MTTLSSDNVFVDSVFEESPPEMSYRSCSRDAITLGSRGSSNGGLEVFIEREEEDIEEEGESHSSVSTRQTVLKVNGYRSSSLSPKKMANGHHSIVELDDTETDGIMNGTDTLQRRESRLKHFKRRLSESFNRRGPSLSPRGEKKPKSRPLSLGISGKNGPLRRNSIATAPATDTIGPTTDDFKPMNAFKSSNNFVNSATLPLRRHSTSCSHSPLGSPFGRLETYKKLDALGEGSYATVYKGISTANGHFVALKEIRLNSEEGTPFTAIREASLLKGLKHSNIVTLHDIIHTPNNLTFVFEYVDTDLSRFMEKHPGPLDPRNVRILLLQLLRGLHFCHRRKILHRDLKPQNILLNHNGELKLADFGLARAKSVPTKTYSHEVVTLWYRPPDVLMGSTEYSTSLDMWGVGCIFVEMLTGKPLFPGLKGVYDQLNRIWGILGTPNEKTWPGIKRLSEYKPEMYEQCDYLGLEVVAPILHPHNKAGNLATKLLQLLPPNRISAEDALAHEYFSSLPPALFTLPDSASIFLIPGVLFYR